MAGETQRWELAVRGHRHRVEIDGSVSRTIRWFVDEQLVASKKSSENDVQLEPEADTGEAIGARFTALGRPRRVTLFEGDDDTPAMLRAVVGTGGLDLDPEPGSAAALREQRIREHPVRHTVVATAGGVAKVVVPIVLGLLVVRFAITLPWPDWDIPWPDLDLPGIPWPDIPWPDLDLPDWTLPAWVQWALDKLRYVWPVVLALVLATSEINRRRKQDALKAELGGAPARRDPDLRRSDDTERPGGG
jgi:hypothetical protein